MSRELNIGGMGPRHDGFSSVVSLVTDQLPSHTHVPAQNPDGFGNIVTWTSTEEFIGPIDQAVPNTGTDSGATNLCVSCYTTNSTNTQLGW